MLNPPDVHILDEGQKKPAILNLLIWHRAWLSLLKHVAYWEVTFDVMSVEKMCFLGQRWQREAHAIFRSRTE